jgi:hypothetical protein
VSDHLISRPAYSAPCTACQQRLILAIDGGLTIAADPAPLSVNEEIAARLTKRGVYDLVKIPGSKTWLIHRDIFRVKAGRTYPVLGDHACPVVHHPLNPWRIPPQRAASSRPREKPARPDTAPIPF